MAGVPHAGGGTHRFHKDARSSNITDKCTRPTAAAAAYKNKKKKNTAARPKNHTARGWAEKRVSVEQIFCDDKALAVSAASAAWQKHRENGYETS